MKITGLQKVSTIDYPGEICCVVFLWGCNFRCGFCYNPDLVIRESEGEFSEEYFFDFLSRRMGKLDGVCVTGGEPLLSLNKDFLRRIRAMGFKVKLDTNGSFPEKLREIIDEGLVDYVAMDVKGARDDYEKIVASDVCLKDIEKSMKIVNDFGNSEFRTTVVPGLHNLEKFRDMGKWMGQVCEGKVNRIFLQGFKVNKEGMIDAEFLKKDEVFEEELLRIRDGVLDLFGEVDVRV